jgi:hypothetical protein
MKGERTITMVVRISFVKPNLFDSRLCHTYILCLPKDQSWVRRPEGKSRGQSDFVLFQQMIQHVSTASEVEVGSIAGRSSNYDVSAMVTENKYTRIHHSENSDGTPVAGNRRLLGLDFRLGNRP